MSVKASTWAWEMPLKGNEKLVLLALADHADDAGQCWPGLERIAEKCGISRASVIEHLNKLTEIQIISRKKMHDENGYRRSNLYVLNLNQSQESILRNIENLSPEILRRKNLRRENLRRNFESLSPDFRESNVQNLDGNIINRHKATIIEPSIKNIIKSLPIEEEGILPSEPESLPRPPEKPKKKKQKKAELTSEQLADFKKLYEFYPRHVSEEQAKITFQKIHPPPELLEKMFSAIANQIREREVKARCGMWQADWKHLSTWLNGKNWTDEVNLSEEYWKNESAKRNGKTNFNSGRKSAVERRAEFYDDLTQRITGEGIDELRGTGLLPAPMD